VVAVSGAVSRPSKNNRQGYSKPPEPVEPGDLPQGTGLRPLSVEPERRLRDEAVLEVSDGPQARPWYSVVQSWREWYADYLGSHIEFTNSEGETVRTALENSYMPDYGKRYYAKLKDFERGVSREFESMTTVMLTFTASNRNTEGGWRCPADHMRDIMGGYDAARKQLHQVLSGQKWEYARVWEPHGSGYGHLHMAVFVEDDVDEIVADQFKPVMRSHVNNCSPAGSDAHRNEPCEEHAGQAPTPWQSAEPSCDDCDSAVSVNDNVENLGSYVSEYIGIFGDETLNRPMKEQMFYAVTWATNTRRVDFSNGAQEVMNREHVRRRFRRETDGLEPEDCPEAFEEWREDEDGEDDEDGPVSEWVAESICTVKGTSPSYADPTTGGVRTTAIEGRQGVDPPPEHS